MDALNEARGGRAEEPAVDLLALTLLRGAGAVAIARVLERFGGSTAAMDAGSSALARVIGVPPETLVAEGYPSAVRGRAHAILEACAADGVEIVTVEMGVYPGRLRQLHDPPPFVFLRGDPSLLERRSVTIVGSRRSTSYGRCTTEDLAGALGRAGVVVVSGMALGIDGAAHRGCLAVGGATVAVLGSGPDVLSPPSHRRLGMEIAQKGLIVTEFLPGEPPRAHHFPRRNRLLAALADAVVVVEATERSGAMITVGHALDLGRDVFAAPGPVGSPTSRGTNALIRDGAGVITSAEEFVTAFLGGDSPSGAERPDSEPVGLGAEALELWRALAEGPAHVDQLARRTRLPPARALARLAELEVVGWAVRDAGMRFRRPA